MGTHGHACPGVSLWTSLAYLGVLTAHAPQRSGWDRVEIRLKGQASRMAHSEIF